MKINFQLVMDPPPPIPQEKKSPTSSIDDRIQYASDCLECGDTSALTFLKGIYDFLRKQGPLKKGDQKRLDYIQSILLEYGLTGNIPTGNED